VSPFDHPVALTLFGFAVLSVAFIIYEVRRSPLRPSEPSAWDARDGVATCYLRCSLPGTILRRERDDLGGQWVPVCPGHSDLGDYEGWWADRDLTHTEAREVHDDARRITGEAAGGGRG
jgi:hypothetical protein